MRLSRLSVRFWGVRGSLATGGSAFAAVGGNTTCVEVRAGDELIIFDAGTGVFPLGQSLPSPVRATFLMTHFHWDHIQGLPLFRPAYQPGNRFTIFGLGTEADEVEAVFAKQMQAPNFPVPLDALAAEIEFRALQGGDDFELGAARIRTAILNHPQGCLGYRVTVGNKSIAFVTDSESIAEGVVDPALLNLVRGVDVLIHDSQYTDDEYNGHCGPCRKGWGHSTYAAACEVARRASAQQLVLFHHDPSHDDAFMEDMAGRARALFANTIVAREGLVIDVATHAQRLTPGVAAQPRRAA